MARIHLSSERPEAANAAAASRIHGQRARSEGVAANAQTELAQEIDLTRDAWLGTIGVSRPEVETTVEVVDRVPLMQQWLLQSRMLQPERPGAVRFGVSRVARFLTSRYTRYYRENSFSMLEYSYGERPKDRRHQRYVVVKTMPGFILPHVVRGDDRGPKKLADARMPSRPERKRRDALILGGDGKSSWAGGVQSKNGKAIAVGKDIGVIGFDSRPLRRPRLSEVLQEKFLNTFGIDRRLKPNAVAQALGIIARGESAAEAQANAAKLRDIRKKLTAIGEHAVFLTQRDHGLTMPGDRPPVLPPHPGDRRTPRWEGWGDNDKTRSAGPRI